MNANDISAVCNYEYLMPFIFSAKCNESTKKYEDTLFGVNDVEAIINDKNNEFFQNYENVEEKKEEKEEKKRRRIY